VYSPVSLVVVVEAVFVAVFVTVTVALGMEAPEASVMRPET
jgi:hypothetical protein